ncbi:hypothetical protein BB559_002081 [Furculomyces boomerangus]|uniref:Transmembrane protein 242 n=2 Tax=Harpellales TaxID=61421 RepID=A0A2T9YYA8_9FUNG|nr:hypothetical protein BB559_002081 [Furculomyces boomerangus]PWA00475.1 hypothetical protein BB558_003494 [Smittium angustum]
MTLQDSNQNTLENDQTKETRKISLAEQLEEFNTTFENSKPKPTTFLAVAGASFGFASLAAMYFSRKKVHKLNPEAKINSGESGRLAMRAFGIATLGCVSVFGIGMSAATIYLRNRGVQSVPEFTLFMKEKFESMFGPPLSKRVVDSGPESEHEIIQSWVKAFEDADKISTPEITNNSEE